MKWTRNNGRFLNEKWHEFRQRARETAFHPELFADSDRIEYDLENARITGQDNRRTYIWDRDVAILGENGYDVRDGDRR